MPDTAITNAQPDNDVADVRFALAARTNGQLVTIRSAINAIQDNNGEPEIFPAEVMAVLGETTDKIQRLLDERHADKKWKRANGEA